MTDKLQDTVNRENALHGETILEDQAEGKQQDGEQRSVSTDKRDELKARIAAGQQRHEQRTLGDQAKSAAETATQFAKEHPVATVLGGLAVGLLVGSMTRRGRSIGRRAGSFASHASEAAMAFGLGLLDDAGQAARGGKDALGDAGERLGLKARQAKRDADYYTRTKSDTASTATRLLGRSLSRRLRDL